MGLHGTCLYALALTSILDIATVTYADNDILNLELLQKGLKGSQCLDGSQAGFYYGAPFSDNGERTFVINLEGGGHCITQSSCEQRAQTYLGSSKYWSQSMSGNGAYSNSAAENPYFYDAHHIFIPYCCGDWHSGQVTVPSNASWNLYFDGHYIVQNILDVLIAKYNLLNATHILIGGQSAGAIGTFLNLDFIANYVNATENEIVIKGAPNSGWFFAGNTSDQTSQPMMPPNDYEHYIVMQDAVDGGWGHDSSVPDLWDAYLQPNCVEDLAQKGLATWHCFSIHNLYPYIETPLFIMNNQFDSDEILNEMAMPNTVNSSTTRYVQYFGGTMANSLLNYLLNEPNPNGNGLFLAGCYDHVTGLDVGNSGASTTIHGYNTSQIVGDWYWQQSKYPHILYDECDTLPCNPTCTAFQEHGL